MRWKGILTTWPVSLGTGEVEVTERRATAIPPPRRGDPLRACLTTPKFRMRLVNLPSYTPDFNADEVVRPGCARE